MNVRFHRLVQRDFLQAINYYRRVAGDGIAERFEAAFRQRAEQAAIRPEGFHFAGNGLRRAGLRGFPWHFLFRVRATDIFITVLRHDKRHPDHSLNR